MQVLAFLLFVGLSLHAQPTITPQTVYSCRWKPNELQPPDAYGNRLEPVCVPVQLKTPGN